MLAGTIREIQASSISDLKSKKTLRDVLKKEEVEVLENLDQEIVNKTIEKLELEYETTVNKISPKNAQEFDAFRKLLTNQVIEVKNKEFDLNTNNWKTIKISLPGEDLKTRVFKTERIEYDEITTRVKKIIIREI